MTLKLVGKRRRHGYCCAHGSRKADNIEPLPCVIFDLFGTVAASQRSESQKQNNMNEEIKRGQEEERQLRRLPIWAWYIKGARDMLQRLRGHALCDEPKPKGWIKEKDGAIYNKAILDMLLSDKLNVDRFLHEEYEIRFTDHEKDKKGKLVRCRAYFAKRTIRYEEI